MVSTQRHLGVARNSNEANYRDWAAKHPDVVALFMSFAKERMRMGQRFGIKALVERVRWELPTRFTAPQGLFRLNNSWTAYLSRDLLAIEPRMAEYITTRRVKGDL